MWMKFQRHDPRDSMLAAAGQPFEEVDLFLPAVGVGAAAEAGDAAETLQTVGQAPSTPTTADAGPGQEGV